jgi:hypothetical protein
MSVSLDNIITAIKDSALLNNLFKTVEQYRLNIESSSDTQLPKLFIKLDKIDYSKQNYDTAEESYFLSLIIIAKYSTNPINNLKTLLDTFINNMFTNNPLLSNMAMKNKIKLLESDLSNDRDKFSSHGGEEGVTLKLSITDNNNFKGKSC